MYARNNYPKDLESQYLFKDSVSPGGWDFKRDFKRKLQKEDDKGNGLLNSPQQGTWKPIIHSMSSDIMPIPVFWKNN